MLFRELKQDYPVYGLYKGDELKVVTGKVVNVSQSHLENVPMTMPGQIIPKPGQMVIDVTLEVEGVTNTYSIPENSSFVYAGNLALATDKDVIVKEVEVIKNQSEEALSKVEYHQNRAEKCKEILASWNPVFKEREDNEKRFSKIEGDVNEIKSDLKELLKKLS